MYPLNFLCFLLWAWVIWFFRLPVREFSAGEQIIVAPADGKVVVIEETFEPEYFKDKRLHVSIFMSPLNVHVNRSPIDGVVKYMKYHPGKYLVAWHPKSSTDNERTSLVIENSNVAILLRQVAGALARRICFYVKEGQEVKQNEEFGFIRFGSRVDVYLTLGTEIDVKIGQADQGGITTLAHLS
jgi:phosphatidylserine decarboxylase